MSVTRVAGGRTTRQLAKLGLAVAAILLLTAVVDAALAQGTPFGGPKGAPPTPPPTGFIGWIFAKQAEFYRQFSSLIRAAKADGSAVWGLLGVAFLYGVFHAAGPGHGKAVISSYVVANNETWRRGVVLSFASALLQAIVAVLIVGIAAALLNATAQGLRRTTDVIEIASYLLIIWIGGRLLVVKGWAFLRELLKRNRGALEAPALAMALALIDVGFIEAAAAIAYGIAKGPGGIGLAEILYGIVHVFCIWLLWVKGQRLLEGWRKLHSARALGAAVTPIHSQAHDHGHAHHDAHAHDHGHAHDHAHGHQDQHVHHDHQANAAHEHQHAGAEDHHHHGHTEHDHAHARVDNGHDHNHSHHDHAHEDASAWSHAHAPEPEELAGPGGWKRGLSAILAVGIRPCSGAIIVLVFALAQGLFWAGVAATFVMGLGTAITVALIATIAVGAKSWAGSFASLHSGFGMVAMRGIEVGAALMIIAFGALMLTGYMFSERMI
jgi:nickel/cobalt exporter